MELQGSVKCTFKGGSRESSGKQSKKTLNERKCYLIRSVCVCVCVWSICVPLVCLHNLLKTTRRQTAEGQKQGAPVSDLPCCPFFIVKLCCAVLCCAVLCLPVLCLPVLSEERDSNLRWRTVILGHPAGWASLLLTLSAPLLVNITPLSAILLRPAYPWSCLAGQRRTVYIYSCSSFSAVIEFVELKS